MQGNLIDSKPPEPLTLLLALARATAPVADIDAGDEWLIAHGMLAESRLSNGGTCIVSTPLGRAIAERAAEQILQARNIVEVMKGYETTKETS